MTTATAVKLPPLSQSLQAKMACPHQYAETVIRGRQLPSTDFARRGIHVHATLEVYLQRLVTRRVPSDYEYFDQLVSQVAHGEAASILEGMKETLIIDPERVVAIEPYLALDEDLNPIEVDPARPSHLYQEEAPEGAAFAGIPDFVQAPSREVLDCFDWKSWFQVIDPDTFQSRFYPFLLFRHFPAAQTIRFHLKFVRYGAARTVEFTRADHYDKLEREARRERERQRQLHILFNLAASEAAGDELEARPGAHCVYCPLLRGGCPIAESNPYTSQAPEDRLRFIVWASEAVKHSAGVLRDFVKVNGPVEVRDANGKTYRAGYEPEVRGVFPLIKTVDVIRTWEQQCAAAGKPDPILAKLAVASTELNKYLKAKKREPLSAALGTVKETDVGTRWTVGRVKAAGEVEEEGADQ